MPRARRKPKNPARQQQPKQRPVDEPMKLVRIARYGATETDWRDQRWETPHGRLVIRFERHRKWLRLPDKQRRLLVGRDLVWIEPDEYEAAERFLDLRMAFLRAYGAPGLPSASAGEEPFVCGRCGAGTRCDPCARDHQAAASDGYDEANRVVRACGEHVRQAFNAVLVNPHASADYRPEEAMASLIPVVRIGLAALAAHFGGHETRAA